MYYVKMVMFVAALMIAGCFLPTGKEPLVTMHADTTFTPAERTCLEDSASQWSEQTSGMAGVNYVYDYHTESPLDVALQKLNHRVVRWTSVTPIVVETEKERSVPGEVPYVLLGEVNVPGGIHNELHKTVEMRIIADRLVDPHKCKLTVLHELGHVFGMDHIERNKSNVMYSMVINERTACMKNDDLLIFCYVNNCANVVMKPCPDQEL